MVISYLDGGFCHSAFMDNYKITVLRKICSGTIQVKSSHFVLFYYFVFIPFLEKASVANG